MGYSPQPDQHLSCEELTTINKLWAEYSDGKFGFRAQRDIWQKIEEELRNSKSSIYDEFSEEVGWKSGGQWLSNRDLVTDIKAPSGHLPTDLTAMRNNDKIYSVIHQAKDCPF